MRKSTSGFKRLLVDNAKHARLDRPREMAQPVAGAFLSPRLCRAGRPLFSTLGLSEAIRNYLVYRRRTRAGPTSADARLRGRLRHSPELGFDACYGLGDELLERLRGSRSGCCRHSAIATGTRVPNGTIASMAISNPYRALLS